jgi:hypothetical protein
MMRRLLEWARQSNSSSLTSFCARALVVLCSSCCYHSRPDVQCASCNETMRCNPKAECYTLNHDTNDADLWNTAERTSARVAMEAKPDATGKVCRSFW